MPASPFTCFIILFLLKSGTNHIYKPSALRSTILHFSSEIGSSVQLLPRVGCLPGTFPFCKFFWVNFSSTVSRVCAWEGREGALKMKCVARRLKMNEKSVSVSLKFPTICFLKLKLLFNFIALGQEGWKTEKVSRRRRRKKKTQGRASIVLVEI